MQAGNYGYVATLLGDAGLVAICEDVVVGAVIPETVFPRAGPGLG